MECSPQRCAEPEETGQPSRVDPAAALDDRLFRSIEESCTQSESAGSQLQVDALTVKSLAHQPDGQAVGRPNPETQEMAPAARSDLQQEIQAEPTGGDVERSGEPPNLRIGLDTDR